MLLELFTSLSAALHSNMILALFSAFIWGVASILLSPCHLTSIPLIVGFVNGQGQITPRRAFILSLLFSAGIILTIAIIGTVTAVSGRMLGNIGVWGNYFVAVILILIGSTFLDVFKLPDLGGRQPVYKRKGPLAAFILGLLFGLALGPCTFAYLSPILAIAFRTGMKNVLYGSLLTVVYAFGHCSIIMLAGTSTGLVEKYLRWNERSKGTAILKKICGLLVMIGGIYLLVFGR
jgi:cytochrome c-type biogenesis protein